MITLSDFKIKVIVFVTIVATFVLPFLANAEVLAPDNAISGALGAIVTFIQSVLIPFLFAIGFFMFVWGVIKFFVIGGNNDDAKAEGKSLIIYALAGFVVILIFWGVVNIIAGGLIKDGSSLNVQTPTLPGAGSSDTIPN